MQEKLAEKQRNLPEPHLHIVPSIEFKGSRFRSIWDRLHPRPLQETFHEFVLDILKSTFGEDWRKQQMDLPEPERHVLIQWIAAWQRWKKVNQTETHREGEHQWSAVASGDVKALLQFAYDVYCLQIVNRLPDFLVNRLKNRNEFQGARYEVAVAAIIARAGYEISFLDDTVKSEKHCEFIAKNKDSGEEIAVEAKSRRRKGVIHEEGQSDPAVLVRGDVQRLFRKACSQGPDKQPYLIFIDMNVLPTPGISSTKKPWLEDIKSMLEKYNTVSKESPDVFNALVLTNFSYYYAGDAEASGSEYVLIASPHSLVPLKDMKGLREVWKSLERYSHIPREV